MNMLLYRVSCRRAIISTPSSSPPHTNATSAHGIQIIDSRSRTPTHPHTPTNTQYMYTKYVCTVSFQRPVRVL